MSQASPSPAPPGGQAAPGEAYVLSLLSQGRLEAALAAIPEFGDCRVYWSDVHNHAQRLLAAGQLEAAGAALEGAISLDPERAEAYVTQGELRLRQRRWADAEAAFRRALAQMGARPYRPREVNATSVGSRAHAAARYGLGQALRQRGKRRQALQALVEAMEADPRPEWTAELQRAIQHAAADPLCRRAQRVILRARQESRERPRPATLSVCMIVRDEEDTLGRCLRSVSGLADEIIVVDTGSRDQTVAIAQGFGAKVHHFQWCDDFAAAKNESLRHAACEWILVLDADDELSDPAGLKGYLAAAEGVNVCTMRTRIPHHGQAGETVVEHPRLFRNHRGLHYRGPVHEQLCDAGGSPAAADAALDLSVYHHGYLEPEAAQEQRRRRNLRILRAWVERDRSDPWAQFCLGQEYYTSRDMALAIPHLEAALQQAAPDRAYRVKAYAYLASAQIAAGQPERAEQTCAAALAEWPEQSEILFCLGYALESQGRVEQAVPAYQAATRGRFGPMLAFHDFTCRDLKPLARLADIHASRGEFDEALECLRRIERIRGDVRGLEDLRQRIEFQRRLTVAAQQGGAEPAPSVHSGQALSLSKGFQPAECQSCAATADARAALADQPEDAAARVRLAATLLGRGESAEAQEHIEAALQLDPASADAINLEGILLCARGDWSAAAERFQRAAALRPDYADALCNLGVARLHANDLARAERAFRQALAADASWFAAHLALGEIACARGDSAAAIASYQSALEQDAASTAAWLGLARSCFHCRAYDRAARCYAQVVELGGCTPDVSAEIERVRRRLADLKLAGAAPPTA